MNDDKNNLTIEEAISVLPEGEKIHIFRNKGNALIGFDVSREKILEQISDAGFLQITGKQAMGMGHGLAIIPKNAKYQSDILFVTHDPEIMKIYDVEHEEEKRELLAKYQCTICLNDFEATTAQCPACKGKDVRIIN